MNEKEQYYRNSEIINMLRDALRIQQGKKASYETRASVILGICITLLMCMMQYVYTQREISISLIIFGLTFIITIILSLFILQPLRRLRKENQEEGIIYGHQIYRIKRDEYYKKVFELVGNSDKIIKEYAKGTYNITKYAVSPRKKIFRLMVPILIFGLIMGIIAFCAWGSYLITF